MPSSLFKRDSRIDAESQGLLLACEPVSQPPQLAAGRLDQEVETATVRELSRLGPGLAFLTLTSLSGMLVSLPPRARIPTNIPTILPDTNKLEANYHEGSARALRIFISRFLDGGERWRRAIWCPGEDSNLHASRR